MSVEALGVSRRLGCQSKLEIQSYLGSEICVSVMGENQGNDIFLENQGNDIFFFLKGPKFLKGGGSNAVDYHGNSTISL